MANAEHVKILKQGTTVWNKWRGDNQNIKPDLSEADLRKEVLNNANLSNALLFGAKLARASFKKVDFRGANLNNAKLHWAIFTHADFTGAELVSAELRETDFTFAKLDKADLSKANLSNAKFHSASLNEANLSEANLSHSDLRGSKLNHVNLVKANLASTILLATKLTHTNLTGAELTKAQLKGANLSYAELEGANLSGANLYEADLRNANFTGANLTGVDFTRAMADENQFSPNQLSNKQRRQLEFSVEITLKEPSAAQADGKQAKYGDNEYSQDRYDGDGGQEGGQRIEGEDEDRLEQEVVKLEERDKLKFSLETKSIMKVAVKLAAMKGSDEWKLTTREVLVAIAYSGQRREKEYRTAQFVLEKLRSDKSDYLEDYFNRIGREKSIDKKIKGKVLKRTGYVGDTLREAKKFAISTTSKNLIQIRHLLASLLFFRAAGKETPGAHNVVKDAGIELPTFIREFQQYVKNKFKEDKTEAWGKIFGEKVADKEKSEQIDTFDKIDKKVAKDEAEGGEVEEAFGASIGGFSVPDQPTKIDALGFEPYTTAIVNFLEHEDTRPPLTMSVEGEWGSGKTSFMLQLEEKLKAQGGLSVRFSPWRHDKEEEVWAAFVLAFIGQLSEPDWIKDVRQNWKLFWRRFDWRAGWLEIVRIVAKLYVYLLVLVFMIIFLWVTSVQYISNLGLGGKLILSIVGAVATIGAVVLKGLKKAREVVGNPFEHDLKKYIQAPDYAGRISFVERFHTDFKNIVKTYAGNKKVYVFIDDLDRCEVPKAAELMKAINLMITDEPNLIFIIGMDRQKVAAGLAVKDKELIRYLRPEMIDHKSDEDKISYWLAGLRYGYSFIEKFIQLPFGIPKPTLSDIDNMMESIRREEGEEEMVPSPESEVIKEDIREDGKKPVGSREEQEDKREEQRKVVGKKQLELKLANDSKQIGEIVHMVCSSLDFNPRRVKQFINLFRLRAYIAYETQLLILPEDIEVSEGVTLEQLGKIVAISLRWPLFLEALERDEFLLWNLSEFAEKKTDDISSLDNVVVRRWARDEQLMKLVSSKCVTEEGKQTDEWPKYTLKHANIDKLLQVSPKIRSMKEVPLEAWVSNGSGVSGVMSVEGKMSEEDMRRSEVEVIEKGREDEEKTESEGEKGTVIRKKKKVKKKVTKKKAKKKATKKKPKKEMKK